VSTYHTNSSSAHYEIEKLQTEKSRSTLRSEEESYTILDKISSIKTILTLRDFTKILKIRDMAVTAKAYARTRVADEAAMLAVEIKLRVERKASEFLAEMKKEGILSAGRPKENFIKLMELEIGENKFQRCQRLDGCYEFLCIPSLFWLWRIRL
jgi:hypothetical protein